ncbi:hypothetical protein GQ42DRAFT_158670 [Ramicandelaber brevisporus]|nr:hypothetical protein GQ42DRAFT_158670 [Ramicandelaber brevisporus]
MAERIPEFSERAVALKRQLTKDPFNIDAWNSLMTEAHSHRNVADIRSCFEALVAQFPTSSKQWIGYIQFEQQQENKRRQQQQQQQQQRFASGANASAASDSDSGADYVGNVFQRSVFNVRTVDLWTEYVQHVIAKHKPLAGHSGQMVYVHSEHEPNHVILQAYSFALQNVGLDPEAGRLWSRFARCIWKDFKGDTPTADTQHQVIASKFRRSKHPRYID